MAGKPGRSGGARPGAGRPPKEPAILELASTYDDPMKFLKAVMNDTATEAKLRVDAAKALMPFVHKKLGESSKANDKKKSADAAAGGKYATRQGPRGTATTH